MTARRGAAAAAVIVAATSAFGVGAVTAAPAPQPAPEVHFELIGDYGLALTWNTHLREGCALELHQGSTATTNPVSAWIGSSMPDTDKPMTAQIHCHPENSTIARYYGPRSPLNDLRTRFNDATQDAFGS